MVVRFTLTTDGVMVHSFKVHVHEELKGNVVRLRLTRDGGHQVAGSATVGSQSVRHFLHRQACLTFSESFNIYSIWSCNISSFTIPFYVFVRFRYKIPEL